MSDIRTALTEAMNGASADAEFDSSTEIEQPALEVSSDAVEDSPQETQAQRDRDDKGRFAAKAAEAKANANVSPEKQGQTPINNEGQSADPAAPVVAKKKAPSSWKPDVIAEWDSLPPKIQDEVLRREGDYFKGVAQLKSSVQQAEAINREVQPYMATIRSLGATAPQAIGHLLNLDHTLRYGTQEQKIGVVRHVMQSAGMNPAEIFGEVQPANPELRPILDELNQLKLERQQEREAATRREFQEINSTLSGFSTDKPHFEVVRNRMADLIELAAQQGQTLSLDDAYDRAIWENPEVRQSLIAERETAAEQRARQATQAARAKTASLSVNGAPNGTPSTVMKAASIRDSLQDAISKHRA